jgi:hypothetical protein
MLVDHWTRIAHLLDAGWSLAAVEREVIEPAQGLDEDERAALWLFAWSREAARPARSGRPPVLSAGRGR